MLNPNIYKRVIVDILPCSKKAEYKGYILDINDLRGPKKKPGRRYMYLKYSIFSDEYYLTSY